MELQSSEVDFSEAERRREEDYILDPRTKRQFHPGVTVAVREVLGEVSALNGFYAMRKSPSGWEKIALTEVTPRA